MTVQIPTFRANIAEQMAAYRERLAERIDKELQRRGQDHHDLAHALRANPRTAERWVSGETEPQRRYRKGIADFFELPIEDLWPELELEDKAFKDWMERVESKQNTALAEIASTRAELGALATQVEEMTRLLELRLGTAASASRSRQAK